MDRQTYVSTPTAMPVAVEGSERGRERRKEAAPQRGSHVKGLPTSKQDGGGSTSTRGEGGRSFSSTWIPPQFRRLIISHSSSLQRTSEARLSWHRARQREDLIWERPVSLVSSQSEESHPKKNPLCPWRAKRRSLESHLYKCRLQAFFLFSFFPPQNRNATNVWNTPNVKG